MSTIFVVKSRVAHIRGLLLLARIYVKTTKGV